MNEIQCPICKRPAQEETVMNRDPREALVRCGMCGSFIAPRGRLQFLAEMTDRSLLPYLSAHIRQNSSPRIPFELDVGNWEQLAEIHKTTSVTQKTERLLWLLAQRTDFPGSEVHVFDTFAPFVDAKNPQEVAYLLLQMHKLEYITYDHLSDRCIIQAKGWQKLQEQSSSGIPGRCFVAMSFDDSLNEAWEKGIYPALKMDCELDPIRIDKIHHNEKICDKLVAEIRLSQFLVADFTLHRAGVYFEAGFALGLGRPVIWTCRKDELAKTHFDTRQYNHIDWTTPEELRERLRDRVLATIPKKN